LALRHQVTRIIPCLEKIDVHASDTDVIRHEILKEFGITTPEYEEALTRTLEAGVPKYPRLTPHEPVTPEDEY
jgi:translation elongation factor EF-4